MDVGWKVVSAVSMGLAGMVAGKIVDVGWKAVTGHPAPTDPDDDNVTLAEIVTFAVLSGAILGLARVLANEGAKKWYGGPAAGPDISEQDRLKDALPKG